MSLYSTTRITGALTGVTTQVKTLFAVAMITATLYAVSPTRFPASILTPAYISPLTTDIDEVLLDDTANFYLTWE